MAAQKMGLKAKIVMPVFTPSIKVNSVRSLGAEVILHGNDFDGAKAECFRLVKETGIVYSFSSFLLFYCFICFIYFVSSLLLLLFLLYFVVHIFFNYSYQE